MKRGALIETTLYLALCAALTVPSSLRAQGIIQIPGNRAAVRDGEAEAVFKEMIPLVARRWAPVQGSSAHEAGH
jgi:hypothetical protein